MRRYVCRDTLTQTLLEKMFMNDYAQRQEAVNVESSYLLRAPAGSGKTGVLVIRYMKALMTCKTPEEVLAFTFTIKAADEMKSRVLKALNLTLGSKVPDDAFGREVYDTALRLLDHDRRYNWRLMENSNRMQIMTFDAYCAKIVRQAPVTSLVGANCTISKHPERIYQEAVRSLLESFKNDNEAGRLVKILLSHVGNNFARAQDLLVELLMRRDQWLPVILEAKNKSSLKEYLEINNLSLMNKMLSGVLSGLQSFSDVIIDSARYASVHNSALEHSLSPLIASGRIPTRLDSFQDVSLLKGLRDWLMTASGAVGFRKVLTKNQGFLAQKDIKSPEDREVAKELKSKLLAGLELMNTDQDMCTGLILLKELSDYRYEEDEWELLSALLELLPEAAARLMIEFAKRKEVDFSQVASSALSTLTDGQSYSDVLFKQDHIIKHILVDEFQDTSELQCTFLSVLTETWVPGDGRTLFLVGDDNQGIYSFRGASVTSFLQATEKGIGNVPLTVLQLSSNFRSQKGAVDWVNACFGSILPRVADVDLGLSAYSPALAQKEYVGKGITVNVFDSGESSRKMEARFICEEVSRIQDCEPEASIAILGSTRRDLIPVIEELKGDEVGHRAVDIHPLSKHPAVIDLACLTMSIVSLCNRSEWVALLRSPLCGLSLQEINRVLMGERYGEIHPKAIVIQCVKSRLDDNELSKDTRTRLKKLVTVVENSLDHIERKSLSTIVEGAFYSLGGMSALRVKQDITHVETFLEMLSEFEYDTFCMVSFKAALNKLYATDEKSVNCVNVMTKHAAKGLEFDYVFIPGGDREGRGTQNSLLSYDVLYTERGMSPLLAPSDKVGMQGASLYRMISRLKGVRAKNEKIRLEYVGLTRAKKKTHVSGIYDSTKADLKFSKNSLLNLIQPHVDIIEHSDNANVEQPTAYFPSYRVIQSVLTTPLPAGQDLAKYRGIEHIDNSVLPKLDWHNDTKRIKGIVIHAIFEEIAAKGFDSYFEMDLVTHREKWKNMLRQGGMQRDVIVTTVYEIERQLAHFRCDEKLRWMLQLRDSLESEKEIYTYTMGKVRKNIIDLTFVENSTRYIFDIKTSEPFDNETEEQFISRMLAKYEQPMQRYSECFIGLGETNIRTGLYLGSICRQVLYPAGMLQAA